MRVFYLLVGILVWHGVGNEAVWGQKLQFSIQNDANPGVTRFDTIFKLAQPQTVINVKLTSPSPLQSETLFVIIKDEFGTYGRYYMLRGQDVTEAFSKFKFDKAGAFRVMIYNPLARTKPYLVGRLFITSKEMPSVASILGKQRVILASRGLMENALATTERTIIPVIPPKPPVIPTPKPNPVPKETPKPVITEVKKPNPKPEPKKPVEKPKPIDLNAAIKPIAPANLNKEETKPAIAPPSNVTKITTPTETANNVTPSKPTTTKTDTLAKTNKTVTPVKTNTKPVPNNQKKPKNEDDDDEDMGFGDDEDGEETHIVDYEVTDPDAHDEFDNLEHGDEEDDDIDMGDDEDDD